MVFTVTARRKPVVYTMMWGNSGRGDLVVQTLHDSILGTELDRGHLRESRVAVTQCTRADALGL